MASGVEIVETDATNVDACGLCGANPLGLQRKREWIRQCLPEGLRYLTLRDKATGAAVGMIEYMPAETAWRAVAAPGYLVIHCLQVPKAHAGKGYGSLLIQACLRDASRHGMAGVAALATTAGWCADQRVYLRNGFEAVDRADPGLELMAVTLRKDCPPPTFGDWRGRLVAMGQGVTLYVSKQCPFMRGERERGRVEQLRAQHGVEARLVEVHSHQVAQDNPCVWGTAGSVCNGTIVNYVQGGDGLFWKKLRRMGVIAG